jgi:biofilm PGA synthesis N-glycosyltransferase PgaC
MITFDDVLIGFVALYPLFMSFVWTIGGLLFYFRWERRAPEPLSTFPFFSIVVAAHNEEHSIAAAVTNLAHLTYPRYEVIVVNDGSTDGTRRILDRLAKRESRWLKVVHLSPNSGKSRAVNTGVLFSRGSLILVMDADCFIDRNALQFLAGHFIRYPRVGAVTGNPRIINRTSLLGKIQVGEYSSIIGLIKRSQRILGKVLTVSGVMAAYRKSAFCDSGLFDADTATEDIDITWKLQKRLWEVRYEPQALCHILSPETLKGLWRQRVRWAEGGAGVLKKHYDVWFDGKQKRFWFVYAEYVAGILWSFSLAVLIGYWLVSLLLHVVGGAGVLPGQPFVPPPWTGSILALVCLLQFLVSLFIDYHYEKKSLFKYYIWIIWYPFFYWLISACAIYVGVYRVFIRRGEVSAVWKSPDRGFHTLKS